jgi:hypothetical protein
MRIFRRRPRVIRLAIGDVVEIQGVRGQITGFTVSTHPALLETRGVISFGMPFEPKPQRVDAWLAS